MGPISLFQIAVYATNIILHFIFVSDERSRKPGSHKCPLSGPALISYIQLSIIVNPAWESDSHVLSRREDGKSSLLADGG